GRREVEVLRDRPRHDVRRHARLPHGPRGLARRPREPRPGRRVRRAWRGLRDRRPHLEDRGRRPAPALVPRARPRGRPAPRRRVPRRPPAEGEQRSRRPRGEHLLPAVRWDAPPGHGRRRPGRDGRGRQAEHADAQRRRADARDQRRARAHARVDPRLADRGGARVSGADDPQLAGLGGTPVSAPEQVRRVADMQARIATQDQAIQASLPAEGGNPEVKEYVRRWNNFRAEVNTLQEQANSWWHSLSDEEIALSEGRLNNLVREWNEILPLAIANR